MTEIIDDISLRWALRDIIAGRHRFTKVSEAKIQRLRELGWIQDRDGGIIVTDSGQSALPELTLATDMHCEEIRWRTPQTL